MKSHEKKPLYRRVNTKARGVSHRHGGDYKDSRRRESGAGMKRGVRRGLDHTPLFKFLLSKVGQEWGPIHQEARSRLIDEEPIFWMVAMDPDFAEDVVRVGDSTYYSGLLVDEDGILRVVDPSIDEGTLKPSCKCCTHTFNGVPFTRVFPQ